MKKIFFLLLFVAVVSAATLVATIRQDRGVLTIQRVVVLDRDAAYSEVSGTHFLKLLDEHKNVLSLAKFDAPKNLFLTDCTSSPMDLVDGQGNLVKLVIDGKEVPVREKALENCLVSSYSLQARVQFKEGAKELVVTGLDGVELDSYPVTFLSRPCGDGVCSQGEDAFSCSTDCKELAAVVSVASSSQAFLKTVFLVLGTLLVAASIFAFFNKKDLKDSPVAELFKRNGFNTGVALLLLGVFALAVWWFLA